MGHDSTRRLLASGASVLFDLHMADVKAVARTGGGAGQKAPCGVQVKVEAIERNARAVSAAVGSDVDLIAVVKADGYGHGVVRSAQAALRGGASALAVGRLDEAASLRAAGITAEIVVLAPFLTGLDRVQRSIELDVTPSLSSEQDFDWMGRRRSGTPVNVQLSVDTGLAREGVAWDSSPAHWLGLARANGVRVTDVWSHLADGSNPTAEHSLRQVARFRLFREQWCTAIGPSERRPRFHIANSSATLRAPSLRFDRVRVGLALYAGARTLGPSARSVEAALSMSAPLVGIRSIQAGTPVGYGGTWVARKATRIGLVAAGYRDGLPRVADGVRLAFRGRRVRVIGRLSMDQLTIDLGTKGHAEIGDPVTLIGRDGLIDVTAEDWADRSATITWEVLMGVGSAASR